MFIAPRAPLPKSAATSPSIKHRVWAGFCESQRTNGVAAPTSSRYGFLLLDNLVRALDRPRLAPRAGDESELGRLAGAELAVDRAQQDQVAQQVEPGREQEEERQLRAVGVEAAGDVLVQRKRERQHLDQHAR